MSQENQSSLRFSLEESLWFRKGQEVDELVSISLSPDITIQEKDQYISIRGALDLTGEYACNAGGLEENAEGSPAQRYVQFVEPRDEGLCEFAHRFPVDITIPVNRIESIYDIDVIVDSFDYAFPERSCMKLTAELIISGLYGGTAVIEDEPEEIVLQERAPDAEAFDEDETVPVEVNAYENEAAEGVEGVEELVFEAEARRMPDDDPADDISAFSPFPFSPPYPSHWNQVPGGIPNNSGRSEKPAFEQTPVYESPAVSAQPEYAQVPEMVAVPEAAEEQPVITEETVEAVPEESSSSSPVQKKKSKKKKSMSLTEFFARKDESEQQAKLKVCIVQKGDTLDRISDRYDVTIQNLLRCNNLEVNQDVYEGQVLYIPAAHAKK